MCQCLEQVRRCAAQTSARLKRTKDRKLVRISNDAKQNKKPAARSEADAAEPLGISLCLSRLAATALSFIAVCRRCFLLRCKPFISLSASFTLFRRLSLRHYPFQAFQRYSKRFLLFLQKYMPTCPHFGTGYD